MGCLWLLISHGNPSHCSFFWNKLCSAKRFSASCLHSGFFFFFSKPFCCIIIFKVPQNFYRFCIVIFVSLGVWVKLPKCSLKHLCLPAVCTTCEHWHLLRIQFSPLDLLADKIKHLLFNLYFIIKLNLRHIISINIRKYLGFFMLSTFAKKQKFDNYANMLFSPVCMWVCMCLCVSHKERPCLHFMFFRIPIQATAYQKR